MTRYSFLALAVLLGGCSTVNSVVDNLFIDPLEVLRKSNQQKIAGLQNGASRGEVEKAVMGSDAAGGAVFDALRGRFQHLAVKNPMRDERVRVADGAELEVLYYYTDLKQRDDRITDDELTPLVFRDGKLVGKGHDYLRAQSPKR
jgi:hypothetical protein